MLNLVKLGSDRQFFIINLANILLQAFVALKFHLPAVRCNAKRVSKLKILRAAINYIAVLTDLLCVCTAFAK